MSSPRLERYAVFKNTQDLTRVLPGYVLLQAVLHLIGEGRDRVRKPARKKKNPMCRHILVVEDDRVLCSLLQQLLESEGYTVDTASDGQIAWEKLARQMGTYAAVLTDIEMPHMNGLQLLQALKQPEADWGHPLLVMSANSEALQQAMRLGACQVLEKPFDLEVVLEMVATSLV